MASIEGTPEHVQRHNLLHTMLDELVADMITHTGKLPSTTTLTELMSWSHQQTINPTEKPNPKEEPNG